MAVVSSTVLKSYFETGDFPTQSQFIDLIDTMMASNVRTKKYIVGVAGIAGCDHNFTSVANTTIQSIQLGATTIIPAKSYVQSIYLVCPVGVSSGTATNDVGATSGGSEYILTSSVDSTNDRYKVIMNSNANQTFSAASSVYFSITPSVNWNTLTTGTWEVYVTYVDNSLI